MPLTKKYPFWPGVVAILLLAVLYAAVHSYRYFWDGLIGCYSLEQPYDAGKLIRPAHPVFPLVFYNLFRIFAADISGRSIHMLRVVSIIFSLIGLAAFYGLLKRITGSHFTSGLAVLCVGVSAAWWHHSISGNTFIISIAFLLFSLYVFMWEREGKSNTAGYILHLLFFALAVMFHRFAFFFIIPFALAAFTRRFNVTKSVSLSALFSIGYIIVTSLITAIAFLMLPYLFLGVNTTGGLQGWWNDYDSALPYFTGGFEKSFRGLFSAGLGGITALPRSANLAFKHWEGAQPNAVAGLYYIIFVIIGLGLFFAVKSTSRDDRKLSTLETTFAAFNISALIIVGVICTVLHPYSLSHHLFLIPLVAGILAPWLHRIMRDKPRRMQLLWLIIPVALLCNNWFVKFNRDRTAENNPYIYQAEKAAVAVNDGDLLIDSGVEEGIFRHAYMLYFSGIDSRHFFELPGVMEEDRQRYHRELMKYYSKGNRIIIHEDAIENEKAMLTLLRGMGSRMSLEGYQEFVVQFMDTRPSYFVINAKNYYIFRVADISTP